MPAFDGMIHTVTGEISPSQAGVTLMHQHILFDHSASCKLAHPQLALREVKRFGQKGGMTIVELSSVGIRISDVAEFVRISQATGVNIIAPAGYYKIGWFNGQMKPVPGYINLDWSSDHIAAQMMVELNVGIDGIATNPKAGVLGELGVSATSPTDRIHPFEEKNLRGAVRAQRQTGVSINIHMDIPITQEQFDKVFCILNDEKADLRRVVFSHCSARDAAREVNEHIVNSGANIEYDLFLPGYEIPSCDFKVEGANIMDLISKGHENQILISPDIVCEDQYAANTNDFFGYGYTLDICEELIRKQGFSREIINKILIETPARILSWTALPE